MKKAVVLLIFLFSFCIFSKVYEYAVIKDARGYTEVMENKNNKGEVKAKLKNNTLVRIEESNNSDGKWAKISAKTEYYENKKYVENIDGYVMRDKLSYEFGPVIYRSTDGACDNVLVEKLVLKNKKNNEDFGVIAYYLENSTNRYEGHRYSYSVKSDPDMEYTNILKISNGLELKISEDYESYINGLKYKKININAEKEPVLGQFVPDTSILGIKRIVVLENKNYTYIKIPGEDEGKGCSIEARDRIFVFKDSIPDFSFDIIYKNITDVREFDKWIKVKE